MGTSDASSFAILADGENHVPIYAGFGAIPVAVPDPAPEPIAQRVLELAVPATRCANAAAATDMAISGSALKRERHPKGISNTVPARGPLYGFGVAFDLGADPGK